MLEIRQFPCLSDNYGFLVHDPESGHTAAIDTPEVEPINAALENEGWRLTYILNTHWHPDHVGGNLALKEKWGCEIIGPEGEAAKIPGIDRKVGDGDEVALGSNTGKVFDTPGHTAGHIIYYFPGSHAAFVGDTIFAMGCGRLFEGTPQQMWDSLSKITALPGKTKLYCAHEYTKANADFALTVDRENAALRERAKQVAEARRQNKPTVPTTVELEMKTNPFLRADNDEVRQNLDMGGASAAEVFAEIRRRKDNF